ARRPQIETSGLALHRSAQRTVADDEGLYIGQTEPQVGDSAQKRQGILLWSQSPDEADDRSSAEPPALAHVGRRHGGGIEVLELDAIRNDQRASRVLAPQRL